MPVHTKFRGIELGALSGSLKDTSAFRPQPENLCLLMEQKVALMAQYLSFTKTIKETFTLKKEIDLTKLLSKRQDCIDKIQKTDLSMQKIVNTDAEEISFISDELKCSLDGYLHSIKGLLQQIAPIDAEVMEMVKVENRDVKAELLKTRNSRHAAKDYGTKGWYGPRYLDAKR